MKKKIFLSLLLLMTIVSVGLCSCNGCAKSEAPKIDDPVAQVYHDYDGVVQDFTAGVSHIQGLHRQQMYQLLKDVEERDGVTIEHGYEWRNSRIIFSEAVTFENIDDLHITDINDVFYYWSTVRGPQSQYVNSNVKNGVQIPWPITSPWVEDDDLSDQPLKLSCEQALQRLKEYNGILPKDCNFMTLRLPIGPKSCNPQWVFGDAYSVLFIDAVTGEVRDSNPAF